MNLLFESKHQVKLRARIKFNHFVSSVSYFNLLIDEEGRSIAWPGSSAVIIRQSLFFVLDVSSCLFVGHFGDGISSSVR